MKYLELIIILSACLFSINQGISQEDIDPDVINISTTLTLDSEDDTTKEGLIELRNDNNDPRIVLYARKGINSDFGGFIDLNNSKSITTMTLNGHDPFGNGIISLFDRQGTIGIALHPDFNNTGDSRIITDDLEITGGSDLAEMFDITDDQSKIIPGLIVSIDPDNSGKLTISKSAYDSNIAGVISGANGIKPGIIMGQEGSVASGDHSITLSGRAYVKANTSNGNIKIGDLITSSNIPGEGMRATNRNKSEGAVIGKAMTSLEDESGFILVLVLNQ